VFGLRQRPKHRIFRLRSHYGALMRLMRAVVCSLVLTTLAACGQPAASPQSSASASASPDASSDVIVYTTGWGDDGVPHGTVEVTRPSDLVKLKGAPSDFVDFIGQILHDGADPSGECDLTVAVDGIDPATGVAIGSVGGCGGAEVLWVRWNGRWVEATGTQMGWGCVQLEEFRVPRRIAPPTCNVYTGNEMKTLHYGGPGERPKPGTPGRRVVYMTTLNADSSGADGVTIQTHDDLAKLRGAPSRFIDHMEDQLSSGCTTMVYAIDPKAGVATGSAYECDNPHQIIWMLWHNSWIDVASASGRWPCDDLKRFRVPDDFTGSTCLEWNNNGEEAIVGYDGPEG